MNQGWWKTFPKGCSWVSCNNCTFSAMCSSSWNNRNQSYLHRTQKVFPITSTMNRSPQILIRTLSRRCAAINNSNGAKRHSARGFHQLASTSLAHPPQHRESEFQQPITGQSPSQYHRSRNAFGSSNSGIQIRTVFIQTENTPNPESIKFLPSNTVRWQFPFLSLVLLGFNTNLSSTYFLLSVLNCFAIDVRTEIYQNATIANRPYTNETLHRLFWTTKTGRDIFWTSPIQSKKS